MAGLFVSFEGIDRAGKTTQARLLCDALGDRALAVRDPGGTAVGERVRDLIKERSLEVHPRTEALLFAAARAELVARLVRPALAAGRIVVSDRFVDSSLAYQGGARGLGVDEVAAVNRFATEGLTPDLTILLSLDPGLAGARAGEGDRFEDEGVELQARVQAVYERLASAERWLVVDAGRPAAEVHAEVLHAVEAALAAVPA